MGIKLSCMERTAPQPYTHIDTCPFGTGRKAAYAKLALICISVSL